MGIALFSLFVYSRY